mgnify:CR=1 FL=1
MLRIDRARQRDAQILPVALAGITQVFEGGARRMVDDDHLTGRRDDEALRRQRAQAAYPYYMQFAKDDDQRFWFYNSMHFPEPMCAFDSVTGEQWQRPGRRSDGAVFTVDTFSRYLLHDVVHHGWDVTGVEAGDAAE